MITRRRRTGLPNGVRVALVMVLVLGLVFAAMIGVRASGITCRDFSLDLGSGAVGAATAREAFDQWRVREGPVLVPRGSWAWNENDSFAHASYWHWHLGLRKVQGGWFATSNECR